MRLIGTIAALFVISGCAPTGSTPPMGADTSARRCFSSSGIELIKFEPGDGVYVRARSGEALLLTGSAACLDVANDGYISLRPYGPQGADICIGDRAHLEIRSPATIVRPCDVQLSRVVPQSEVNRLSGPG